MRFTECAARVWAALTRRRHVMTPHQFLVWLHRREHWIHNHLHTVYFGLVAYESHGFYGKVAGLLFVVSVAGALTGHVDMLED